MNPDEILIDRLRSGDEEAIGDIINKYHKLLCWEARLLLLEKEAAEDVVQDTLTQVWLSKDLLRLRFAGALKRVLVLAVRRSCIKENLKYRSRMAVVRAASHLQEDTIEIEYEGFLERQFTDKLLKSLKSAMQDLTEVRLVVLKKVFFENLRMRQIAEEMNITEDSVHKYRQRALGDLREKMLSRR